MAVAIAVDCERAWYVGVAATKGQLSEQPGLEINCTGAGHDHYPHPAEEVEPVPEGSLSAKARSQFLEVVNVLSFDVGKRRNLVGNGLSRDTKDELPLLKLPPVDIDTRTLAGDPEREHDQGLREGLFQGTNCPRFHEIAGGCVCSHCDCELR